MQEVWERGEASVRDVLEALNARSTKQRAYTTVMTIMVRLTDKGLLERTRAGKTHRYRPALTHDEYLERRAQAEVGAIVAEYGDAALVHFARQMALLDPKRQAQLRRIAGRG